MMETTAGVPVVPSSYYLLDTNGNKICNWPGNPPNYILNLTNPTVAKYVGQYAAQVYLQSNPKYNGVFFDNLIEQISNLTSECYGNPTVHPQTEEYWGNVNPVGPRGCYDEAKRFMEAITMAYHNTHQVETRIVRIFNTYGPLCA